MLMLPIGGYKNFYEERREQAVIVVCAITILCHQATAIDSQILSKETVKDPALLSDCSICT